MRTMFWHKEYKTLDTAERRKIYHGDSAWRKCARSAQWLVPELCDYISPLDIPNLVAPEYGTYVKGRWVQASSGLRDLDSMLSDIAEQHLVRPRAFLEASSTILIDIHNPPAVSPAHHPPNFRTNHRPPPLMRPQEPQVAVRAAH